MDTCIYNKKRFFDWLDKQIDEDEIVIFTTELTGSLTYFKKRNEKRMSFGLAADAFKQKDGIGDIAFGKIPVFAVCVCKQEYASEQTLKLYKSQ